MTETALAAIVTVIPVLLVSGFLATGMKTVGIYLTDPRLVAKVMAVINLIQGTYAAVGEFVLIQALINGDLTSGWTVGIAKSASAAAAGFLVLEGITALLLQQRDALLRERRELEAQIATFAAERSQLDQVVEPDDQEDQTDEGDGDR